MKAYRSLVFGLALVALLRVLEVLPVGAGEAKPPWQSDWERAVEAARKEGQLSSTGVEATNRSSRNSRNDIRK